MLRTLEVLGALAILTIAGALCFALWKARAIKARHLRVFAQPLPALDPAKARLYESTAALFHRTRFADGASFLSAGLAAPCVGDLVCTEEALFLVREPGAPEIAAVPQLVWPIAWIDEASLHRGFAPLAGKELPLLRLRWKRGGEALVSELSLRGGMDQLERLRREIHLRQEGGKALLPLVQLGKLQGPS